MAGRAVPMRRSWALGLLLSWLCCLTTASPAAAGDIAVLLSARVNAYSDALRGLESSLRGHRVIKTYDMEGDAGQGKRLLRRIECGERPDLISTHPSNCTPVSTNCRSTRPESLSRKITAPSAR